MNTTKYIALTIGPIYKAQLKAKKTRELWAASYIFSFIMKQIVLQISGKYENDLFVGTRKFLIPHIANDKIFTSHFGAGLFPDRIIFEAEANDFEQIPKVIKSAIQIVSDVIAEKLHAKQKEIQNFMQQFFRIYAIEKDIDSDINPIDLISKDLNLLECQENFVPVETTDWLQEFFNQVNGSYLYFDGFENQIIANANKNRAEFVSKQAKDAAKRRFPTLAEISLSEFLNNSSPKTQIEASKVINDALNSDRFRNSKSSEEEDTLYSTIAAKLPFKGNLMNYHKYIAIVKVDGDWFGKINNDIYNLEDEGRKGSQLARFNESLFEFNIAAIDAIVNYGGKPIFSGGDDMLFFAPVAIEDVCVFDLIKTIDDIFHDKLSHIYALFAEIAINNWARFHDPSLSFGVSLCYYKFPLNEALEEAESLLYNMAKTAFYYSKNCIAFNLQKHSRKGYAAVFHKKATYGNNLFLQFINLIAYFRNNDTVFGTLHQTIKAQKAMLDIVGSDYDKLSNYFYSTFNETIHDYYRADINLIRDFVHAVYKSGSYTGSEMSTIVSSLRFVKFLTEKDTSNE